ncbi:transglycosylase family protein [Mycobacterium asiaticum]|uniref:Resuscitation-promoting factor n=1 Tax=Mycobacterium asiaticum TaxID=1790 RepID=A0A1A3N2G3_MYCAS|nr:resuscitation-promoting factor [Mycobacterium asiaticum]
MTHTAKPFIKSVMTAGFVAVGMSFSTGVAEADSMNWEAVAQCESGGNWAANTGNGAYGGLQFKQATWEEYGGTGNPAKASKQQQIAVANRVLAGQGPGAWPKCSKAAGATPGTAQLPQPGQQFQQTLTQIIGIFMPKQ